MSVAIQALNLVGIFRLHPPDVLFQSVLRRERLIVDLKRLLSRYSADFTAAFFGGAVLSQKMDCVEPRI